MSDDALGKLLADAAPPARDAAFELAVMARIEQRRFHRALFQNAALAALGALLLAVAAPPLAKTVLDNMTIAGLLLAGAVVLLQSPLMRSD